MADPLVDFNKKVSEFKSAYDYLLKNHAKNPAAKKERDRLLASAKVINGSIDAAKSAISKVSAVKQNAVNTTSNIFTKVSDFFNNGNLGAAPLVIAALPYATAAIVTAAITAITYWLTDFTRLKSTMFTSLVASGTQPAAAAEIVTKMEENSGIVASVTKPLIPILIATGIFWYLTSDKKR